MLPVQFCYDDGTPLGDVKMSRRQYHVGEGVTLEAVATGETTRRFRVVDVDHGLVQATPKSTTYKDSTTTVYVIDADDPRRERP